MSSLSRGCIRLERQFTSSIPHFTSYTPTRAQARFLTSSPILRFAAKARSSKSPKKTIPITPAPNARKAVQPIYATYAQTLAQKPHPTLLYQAPSHTVFLLSSYSGAFFCFTYAAYNLNITYFNPPADLASWVSYSFGGICFLMAAFGGYLLLSPARLIHTISAVPVAPIGRTARDIAAKGITDTASKEATLVRSIPELQIEVELRKMFPIPFFPARKLLARPDEVFLPARLYTADAEAAIMRKEREAMNKVSKKQRERWERNIMSRPFQLLSRGFFNVFKNMARTWSREGFMKMDVKGQLYKLDVTGGWALDNGKAIDRLVTVKPQ